jgi:hypothetical protein
MKICLEQNSFGDYRLCTFDKRNYLTYLFHPVCFDSLYLHSYTNIRAKSELVSLRIVTISNKGPSGEAIATCELTSDYADRLSCMLFIDGKELRFEQGLSFRS